MTEDLGSLLGPGLEVDDGGRWCVARVGFDCSVDTIGVGTMLKTGEFVATMEEGEELFDVLIEYAQVLATVLIERVVGDAITTGKVL